MVCTYPDSLALAHLPTPIHRLDRISDLWGGPAIYIKRDDLTGCALSGNKVRKLEFSVAEALNQGADTLITCGGVQSNHARATAVAAAKTGLRSFLVLRGDPNAAADGNLFLDRLAGSEVTFITPEAYETVDDILSSVADRLRGSGRKPYVIPEGASNATGYWGYIRAAEEIMRQSKEMGVAFDYVVTATGSGGTLGGLLLGSRIFSWEIMPIGINVCDTAAAFQERIFGVIHEMKEKHHWHFPLEKQDILLIDGYVGDGYALSRPEERALITEVAQLEGIILDPVYTGKAMFGLKDQIQKGRFKPGEHVLFLHTGGIFGLLPADVSSLFFSKKVT